ncbi:desulfoferrodoxin [Methanoregula sp.]|uniref:desulfoferrodoxin n=1 Tax=Methanoregula sp. TaxID=2052170 RepID=UPI002635209F|nr:desulfoferrodoxin [Methanoregula sp.]MDD5143432.1 desulfoferrodoxin [Methanoregula sp.]
MTKMPEVYKCGVCGNITMVVSPSGGTLLCCGQPMNLQGEKKDDAGKEKHVPVIGKTANGIRVKLGEIPHPMEEKHFIQWIEVISGGDLYVHGLRPGQAPEAEFPVKADHVKVRAFCNLHGLWTTSH